MPYTAPSTAFFSGSTAANIEINIDASTSQFFKVGSLYDNPFSVAAEEELIPIYRGFLSGQYVYSVGTAPVGAADVIIAGYR